MNLNSRLFDRIRVRPRAAEDASSAGAAQCDHPGCTNEGSFRAPKGRGRERDYFTFCLDHVRAYNQSYNYFDGMSDNDVAAYQKDATIGHRPTWAMGVKSDTREAMRGARGNMKDNLSDPDRTVDPFSLFGAGLAGTGRARREEPRRRLPATALKALDTLGLDEGVDAVAIKARYKLLVKRFHPDTNGGDRSFEDRLQEILRAYNTLKAIGLG